MNNLKKIQNRIKRKKHIRKVVTGSESSPRMSVYRSNNHIYVQLIDDTKHLTIASASDVKLDNKLNPTQKAEKVGQMVAETAIKNKISKVVFDRNGYRYHGRVKALADAARNAGLVF